MSSFKFVHAADIHLDSPLSGLAVKDSTFSALVRNATRRALANVVDLAIEEGAAFVVIAGDLYDGSWKDHSTGQYAVAQFARLTRAGIRVAVVFGNHDAESRVTRHLMMPEGAFAFSSRRCETIELPELGVALHGRSYKEAATTENIAAEYAPPRAGLFNLAILHTALDGHPGHAPYAPTSVGELAASGHDYWALGHVHDHAIRSTHPHIVFPGNTQGRNVRETGTKGAMLVTVDDGVVRTLEHRPTDEVRWAQTRIDAGQAADMPELLGGIKDLLGDAYRMSADRPTAIRLKVKAAGTLRNALLFDPEWFGAELRAAAATVNENIWLEKISIDASEDLPAAGIPPEIAELLAAALEDPDCARAVEDAVAPLLAKLPAGAVDTETAPLVAAATAKDVARLVAAARHIVEARLDDGVA